MRKGEGDHEAADEDEDEGGGYPVRLQRAAEGGDAAGQGEEDQGDVVDVQAWEQAGDEADGDAEQAERDDEEEVEQNGHLCWIMTVVLLSWRV